MNKFDTIIQLLHYIILRVLRTPYIDHSFTRVRPPFRPHLPPSPHQFSVTFRSFFSPSHHVLRSTRSSHERKSMRHDASPPVERPIRTFRPSPVTAIALMRVGGDSWPVVVAMPPIVPTCVLPLFAPPVGGPGGVMGDGGPFADSQYTRTARRSERRCCNT